LELPIVDYLSDKIGERVGGTKEEKKASEFLSKWMKEMGLKVEVQEFKFLGWKPTREATLRVLEPEKMEIKPGLMLFSDNTPEGGVTGKLEYAGIMFLIENLFEWPKYAVVNDEGNQLAYIVAFLDGPTISFPLTKMGRCYGRAPYVLIGKKEYKLFKRWMDKGKDVVVNVNISGEILPHLTSQNVIGMLMGKEVNAEEIIVCAHYDSAYGSPGANDNASGVEAMLKVAEKIIKKETAKTIKFIAFGAEEYLMIGSSYYVESLKEKGQVKKIKAVINLDMVGAGNTLTIAYDQKQFDQKIIKKSIDRSRLKPCVKMQSVKLSESSDHWPFYINGVPTIEMNFWPYNHYHQITDTKDKIKANIVDRTAAAAYALLEELVFRY